MESDEILRRVQSYPAKLVELTGGEPLLQEQGVLELVNALHHSGYSIMLETNGSLNLSQIPKYVRKVVDVKCPGSGYGNSFMISNLECLHDQDELKFVLADEADYRFAKVFIADNQLTDLVLLFSPVTGKLAPVELAEWMLRDGKTARLQIQMHKLLDIK
jgi:7-carboxy-7-deazaguanine synthase